MTSQRFRAYPDRFDLQFLSPNFKKLLHTENNFLNCFYDTPSQSPLLVISGKSELPVNLNYRITDCQYFGGKISAFLLVIQMIINETLPRDSLLDFVSESSKRCQMFAVIS